MKEGGNTIRGTKAQRFETALGGYKEFLDEAGLKLSKAEYYDLLTTQREDFVKDWYDIGMEAKNQVANVIASKAIIKQNVNAIRDKIKGGV